MYKLWSSNLYWEIQVKLKRNKQCGSSQEYLCCGKEIVSLILQQTTGGAGPNWECTQEHNISIWSRERTGYTDWSCRQIGKKICRLSCWYNMGTNWCSGVDFVQVTLSYMFGNILAFICLVVPPSLIQLYHCNHFHLWAC